ncbi:hypothetical protein D3C87_687380 [compost metagenome]
MSRRSEAHANAMLGAAHRRYNVAQSQRKSENVWLVSLLVVGFVIGACAVVGWMLAGGWRSIINALGA